MMMLRTILFLLFLLPTVFFPQSAAAGRCGGKRRCQCGDLVVSNYVMTEDLGPCDKRGLRLTNGVTLDCRDHAITGPGGQSQDPGIAFPTGTTGATVQNCQVSGFRQGIRLRQASKNRVIGNSVHHNGDPTTHVGYGIDVAHESTDNVFANNKIYNNADEGIHIGTESHRNTLINNEVYDNFRENIYVLSADYGVFKKNVIHGGGKNSLFLKHVAFSQIEHNTFRDRPVLIRGQAHDNQLSDNDFVRTGVHFQAHKEGNVLTRPSKNTMVGGKIAEAQQCLRFSDASENVVKGTLFNRCGKAVSSTATAGSADNTLINITLEPQAMSLDDHSLVNVGWQLSATVKDANGTAIRGAQVKGFDIQKKLVFEAVTAVDGSIPPQEVIAYTQQGKMKTSHTPHTLQIATDHARTTQEVTLDSNKTIVISLPSTR
jgi:parallel beta-helix repeat protein